MKTPRILTFTIASLLLSPLAAHAITDTWDGGGVDSFFITGANWVDGTAPASDVLDTDLIFGATARLNPTLTGIFGARSITFSNTAGAYGFSGASLSLGVPGITNNDTQTMTFTNQVSFAVVAASNINANNGGLTFTNTVSVGFATLFISGDEDTTFADITGSGTVNKSGAGAMTWAPTGTTGADFELAAGTARTVADGSTDVFNSGASIAVNGTSTFQINESLTLSGAQLTRVSGADFLLAAGKTLRVQSGGDVTITGLYDHASASTIIVTGSGSTFTTSMSVLTFDAGSTLNVLAGGDVASGGNLAIGFIGNCTALVDGSGSTLSASTLTVAGNGSTGTLTFSNGSTGIFTGATTLALLDGSNGTLNFQSGATATTTGLSIAAVASAATGVVTITGAGSVLTVTGAGTATIGAASGSTAALNVQSDGEFNSGTGLATVNATGTLAVTGGNYISDGSLTINGGQFTKDANGSFVLAAGRTLTAQAGGDITFTGSLTQNTAATITITGAGSTFTMNGGLSLNAGSALNVQASGNASVGFLSLGASFGEGTTTVDGGSSVLSISSLVVSTIGTSIGTTGLLRLQNAGTFQSGTGLTTVHATGTIAISGGIYNANGNLTLNGGQLTRTTGSFNLGAGQTLTVQAGGDAIFTGSYTNSTASTIAVTGAASTFSTTGFISLGSSTFSVAAGGTVSSGAAQINIATFNGNGTVTVDGPGSSLSGGVLNIAQGGNAGSLTFSNGSAGAFAGILVDSAVSQDTSGTLSIQSGASVTGTSLTIAPNAAANIGAVTLTGAGSALTLTGAATATIGAANASIAALTVENGGTFTTGTGLTTVNATGDLNINAGGTMIVRGNMIVHSSLDIENGGTVILGGTPPPAPAPEFEMGEFDFGVLESGVETAAVPEPGVGALLLSALAFLGTRHARFRGARASRVLVSASRRNELPGVLDSGNVSAIRAVSKVREGGTPSPALGTSALPRTLCDAPSR